jgi:hypothetical protein
VDSRIAVDLAQSMFLFCSCHSVKRNLRKDGSKWRTVGRNSNGWLKEVFPYWVALIEEKCTGANNEKIREFCAQRGLSLSRFGHSVVWQKEWYQVFRFGREEDAETFMREFGGERMHPSEREGQELGAVEG